MDAPPSLELVHPGRPHECSLSLWTMLLLGYEGMGMVQRQGGGHQFVNADTMQCFYGKIGISALSEGLNFSIAKLVVRSK